MTSGVIWDAIDTISSFGYSTYAKTVDNFQKKVKKEYVMKVKEHFIENVKYIKFIYLFFFIRKICFTFII